MKYLFRLFFLFTSFLWSQSNDSNYSIKWYNTENGLNQLSIRYCVPDDYGFVWIGTELGLYRFDGLKFDKIEDPRFSSLNKQRITRLGRDVFSKKIYLTTNPDNAIYSIDKNIIEKVETTHPEEKLFTFNQFCINSNSSYVKSILKSKKNIFFLKEYYQNSLVTACLTSEHLYLPHNNNVNIFDKNGLIIKRNIKINPNSLLFQFGGIILATYKDELFSIKNGKVLKEKICIDLNFKKYLDKNIQNIDNDQVFGSEDNYFLKSEGKIYQVNFSNNKLSTKFLFDAPSEDISCITFLKKENVFLVGTRTQGIAVLKPKLFNTIFLDVKKTNNAVNYNYSTVNVSNELWYSASGWSFNFKTKKTVYDNYLIESKNTRFILPYKNKYYFQSNSGLWNIQNHKIDYGFEYLANNEPLDKSFTGYTYHKCKLFISNSKNLFSLNGNKLNLTFSLNTKNEARTINSIFSFNDKILLLTTKGIFEYNPVDNSYLLINYLGNVNARYIKQVDKNSYWVGCYGDGLYLVKNQKVFKVKDINMAITTAHAIEEDNAGNLWISTNDGLLKINKKEAISKISKNNPIECYRFSTENGLLTNEFNGSGTHPSLQAKDGVIGFASMKGFVWFHPHKVSKQLFKGNIIIDKVLNKNKVVSPTNDSYNFPKEVELITVNFSFAYHFNRENLTVSYRFEDQKKWSIINGNTFQIPRYKKGNHQLIIRISTHGFSDNASVFKIINLNFEAKFFETYLFWILISILLLIVLYASYRIGIYLSKQRETQLKERIKEKTAQLQASVLDLENTQISLTNSLNQKNILLKEIHHRVKNNLQLVMSILNIQASDNENTSIEGFIEKGQSRIASMVLIHENLYQKEDIGNIDFDTYMESLVKNIRITFGDISDRISVNLFCKEVFFDIQTSIPLGLIINELVTNSFKHAFPNHRKGLITISIQIVNETDYKLIIQDNGIGIKEEKFEKKSIGLELVSLLVLQLNGQLTVNSEKGTSYEINFSL